MIFTTGFIELFKKYQTTLKSNKSLFIINFILGLTEDN
jgi:hypothetical protein